MSATDPRVASFRQALEQGVSATPGFGPLSRDDRADGSMLISRFEVAPHVWIELTIRPAVPQVRAGIMTDDRWRNEELEEAIEETGDTMSEFVESGFDEVGLDFPEPLVEHYRDQGRFFVFSTGVEPRSLADLADASTLRRARLMLLGYYTAFQKVITRATPAG